VTPLLGSIGHLVFIRSGSSSSSSLLKNDFLPFTSHYHGAKFVFLASIDTVFKWEQGHSLRLASYTPRPYKYVHSMPTCTEWKTTLIVQHYLLSGSIPAMCTTTATTRHQRPDNTATLPATLEVAFSEITLQWTGYYLMSQVKRRHTEV